MGTANHATEDLQHRILNFYIYVLQSGETQASDGDIEREEREKQKSSSKTKGV